jgi:undecaprenyl-diphosphatase
MNLLQAAILGVVQGFSEFLPISSSGHLVLVQNYFGINEGAVVFDIFLHFATLLAVFIYFIKDIVRISIKELFIIGVASIPAAIVGLFFEDAVEKAFGSLLMVGVFLVFSGVLNFITEYKLKKQKEVKNDIGLKEALFIGLFQAIAVLPGISRSGSTVAAGSMQNIDRKKTFRFSFLMVIPVILGANLIQLLRIYNGEPLTIDISLLLVGGILAFASGMLSLKIFEYVIVKAKMNYFGYYCVIAGSLVIVSQLL